LKLKIGFIVVFSMILFFLNYEVKNFYIEKDILNLQKDNKELIFKAQKDVFYVSDIIYHLIINDKVIDAISSKNRAKLKELLQDKFNFLKTKHISQLHFYLKDKTSFIRFNKENRYGDYLGNIRESINKAFKESKPVYGFEIGRVTSGFRAVFPIFKDKKLIGGVEIAFSFDVFRKLIGENYFLLLNKKVVDKTIFKDERKKYVSYPLDKNYLISKEDFLNGKFENIKKFGNAICSINEVKLYKKDKDYYVLDSILIKNFSNKEFGRILYLEKSKDIKYLFKEYEKYNILIIIFAFFSVMILFFYDKIQTQTSLAEKDELTKLLNRRGCNHKIKEKINSDLDASLIMFDIDFFKKINDKYGHDVGDEVLEKISQLVSNKVRRSDVLCRVGGEEFLIYLPNAKLKQAKRVAQNIRKTIESYQFDKVGKVTISMGVTEKLLSDNLDTLMKKADLALYRAKELGRNRVQSNKV